jgi:hypothetical protein
MHNCIKTNFLQTQLCKKQILNLIQAERKALKAGIDSEIGQSLQGLVHLAFAGKRKLAKNG